MPLTVTCNGAWMWHLRTVAEEGNVNAGPRNELLVQYFKAGGSDNYYEKWLGC